MSACLAVLCHLKESKQINSKKFTSEMLLLPSSRAASEGGALGDGTPGWPQTPGILIEIFLAA